MANSYIITFINSVGDVLTVQGTVNGTPVTVITSVALAGNALASAISFENFIAPLMLAALPPAQAAYPTITGLSFSK